MNKMNEELAQTALRCAVCHDQCISACPVFESTRQLAAYPSRKAMISREVDRQLLPPGEDAAKIMRYCIGCKACLETCLHKSNPVDITPVVRHTRRELYISGEISAEFKQLLERIEKWGNPYGDLTAACQLLSEVITGKGNAQEKILLIADASVLYNAESMATNTIQLLKRLGTANIQLAQSIYCGWELWHYGAAKAFEKIAGRIHDEIKSSQVNCVVTLSPQSAFLLREAYQSELGYTFNIPVYSLAEYLLEKQDSLKSLLKAPQKAFYLLQSASEVYGTGSKAPDRLLAALGIQAVERPSTFYPLRNAHYPEGLVLDLHPDPRQVIVERLKQVIALTKAESVVVTTSEAYAVLTKELSLPVQDLAGYLLQQSISA